jgi:hypothetical protein
MRTEPKYFLLSLFISSLVLASLYLFTYYAAAHQDSSFAIVGYVTAFFLSFPVFIFYGADGNPPAVALLIAVLIELLFISVPVYVALLVWRSYR